MRLNDCPKRLLGKGLRTEKKMFTKEARGAKIKAKGGLQMGKWSKKAKAKAAKKGSSPEVPVAFRVSSEEALKLAELCAEHGVVRSDLLRDAVALGLPLLKKKRGWQ